LGVRGIFLMKGGAMFSREELQHIRDKAQAEADIKHTSPVWRSVLLRLANAADHLDAMIARTEVKE